MNSNFEVVLRILTCCSFAASMRREEETDDSSGFGGDHVWTDTDMELPMRPNKYSAVDVVEVGIMIRNIRAIYFDRKIADLDLVLVCRWQDARLKNDTHIKELWAHELNSVMLPTTQVANYIWLPSLVVSNGDSSGRVNTVSDSVIVSNSGSASRIQRFKASLEQVFRTELFPFDEQNVTVSVVSDSLMADELRLSPIRESSVSGVDNKSFDSTAWEFVSQKLTSHNDIYGMLNKSVATLEVCVARRRLPYILSLYFPYFAVLAVSHTGTFFPVKPGYVMPRVATCMIAFMAFVTLMLRESSMLPPGNNASITGYFTACMTLLMLALLSFNCLVEYLVNIKRESLALRVNFELRAGFPMVVVVLAASLYKLMPYVMQSEAYVIAFTQGEIWLILSSYTVFNLFRLKWESDPCPQGNDN